MTMLKELLLRTHENLNILREREAKYSGNAPPELLNQIRDHQTAVKLIKQADSTELTEAELKKLKKELRPLLIASNIEQIDLDKVKLETPPLPFEPETTPIGKGPFLMGNPPGKDVPDSETPQGEIYLLDYAIGTYPVTNEQYAEYIRHTKRLIAPEAGWEGQTPPPGRDKYPVAGVTWYEALAYCAWLSERTGRSYTLPSEAQWEKAARGTDGRIYPWGNTWDAGRCHHGSEQTGPVDAYPAQSVYGCFDMVGNVREWTSTLWGEKRLAPDPKFRYPWTNDEREDLQAPSHIYRVYRGGAAADKREQLRCSARNGYAPDQLGPPFKRHGFRVALKLENT